MSMLNPYISPRCHTATLSYNAVFQSLIKLIGGVILPLLNICEDWLEDLRFAYNTLYVLEPHEDYETSPNVEGIVINQGYRSLQVSELMKQAGLNPSPTSNHLTGCAVDIRCAGVEEALRKMVILLDISDGKQQEFDELILERRRSVYWLHFAVRPVDNRRKISFIINWLKFRKNAVGI